MALTLNNLSGGETGGLEEASAFTGTDLVDTSAFRTGTRYYLLNAAESIEFAPFASISDAGVGYVVGAAVQISSLTPSAAIPFLSLREGASEFFRLEFTTGNDVLVVDANGSTIRTISSPFTGGEYHFVEVYFQHSSSGTVEVFIDDISQGSDPAQDLTDGGTFDTVRFENATGTGKNLRVDDFYILSGATAASDRYGDCEVFGYQAGESSTRVGTPTNGTFTETGDTPGSAEADGTALEANGASALTLTTDLDDATNSRGLVGGPSTGAPHDVSGTIKAAKYIYNLKRGNGSGTSLRYLYGNTGDGETSSADQEANLTSVYATFEELSEAAGVVPLSTEDFSFGISAGTDDTGGREIFAADIWAMLLHVPAAGGVESEELVTDGMYMNDLRTSEVSKLDLDSLYLDILRAGALEKLISGTLLLGDSIISELLRTAKGTDSVLFNEFLTKLQEDQQTDNLPLDQSLFIKKDLAEEHAESLLLSDATQALQIKIRTIVDGLLLDDQKYTDLHKQILDPVFLGENLTKAVESNIVDKLVLVETATRGLYLAGDSLLVGDETKIAYGRAVTDNLLLKSSLISVLEKLVREAVLLKDDRFFVIEKLHLDEILLGDSIVTEAFRAAITRLVTDGLFLNDFLTASIETIKSEGLLISQDTTTLEDHVIGVEAILLGDDVTTALTVAQDIITRLVTDNLALNDILTKEIDITRVDSVLIKTIFTDIIEMIVTDKLLLKDDRVSEVEKTFLTSLLVVDTILTELTRTQFQSDGLFLSDEVTKVLEMLKIDGLFISDSVLTQVGVILIQVTDGLFMLSEDVRDQLHIFSDNVLLNDEAIKESARVLLDGLLLSDETTLQSVRTRLNVDGLLFDDFVVKLREMLAIDNLLVFDQAFVQDINTVLQVDGLYLNDFLTKTLESLIRDNVLLDDSAAIELIMQKLVTDGLFLDDVTTKEFCKQILDGLLLSVDVTLQTVVALITVLVTDGLFLDSLRSSDLSKTITDEVLLKDLLAGISRDRTFADGLLTFDGVLRTTEGVKRDSLLLGDERFSELEKQVLNNVLLRDIISQARAKSAVDGLLLDDSRQSEIELLQQNQVLIQQLASYARDILQRENLLLVDSVVKLVTDAITTILVFALLGAKDLLGIKAFFEENFMLINTQQSWNVAFLGIILGARVESFFESDFD